MRLTRLGVADPGMNARLSRLIPQDHVVTCDKDLFRNKSYKTSPRSQFPQSFEEKLNEQEKEDK
jgi:hypothetical protein